MKTKTYELNTLISVAKSAEDKIKASGESDTFTKVGAQVLADAQKEMDQYFKNLEQIEAKHTEMTQFFGIDKNDECVDKSEDFFKIFVTFFRQVEAAVPKGKKKTGGAKPAANNMRPGPGGVNPLMAELMAKQAEKGMKKD